MGWTSEEVVEGIVEWVSDLNSIEGSPVIIVEGKRDISSLDDLGVSAYKIHLNKGLSIVVLMENLLTRTGPFSGLPAFDRVVVLTDWDRKGFLLCRSLEEACHGLGVPCDTEFRRRIAVLTGKWVRDVESLAGLLAKLKGRKNDSLM